jgi:hypothetical protein
MATFPWRPLDSAAMLGRLAVLPAPPRPRVLEGGDLANAQIGALVSAELLAAEAGLVPLVTLPNGAQGVVAIGAARSKLDQAPESVRTIYLAAHGTARRLTALARPAATTALDPQLYGAGAVAGDAGRIGALPLLGYVTLTVLGVAATVAAAWFAVEARRAAVEADATLTGDLGRANTVATLALAELKATGRVSPGVWEALKPAAKAEASHGWILPAAVVAAVAVGGAVYVLRR